MDFLIHCSGTEPRCAPPNTVTQGEDITERPGHGQASVADSVRFPALGSGSVECVRWILGIVERSPHTLWSSGACVSTAVGGKDVASLESTHTALPRPADPSWMEWQPD